LSLDPDNCAAARNCENPIFHGENDRSPTPRVSADHDSIDLPTALTFHALPASAFRPDDFAERRIDRFLNTLVNLQRDSLQAL